MLLAGVRVSTPKTAFPPFRTVTRKMRSMKMNTRKTLVLGQGILSNVTAVQAVLAVNLHPQRPMLRVLQKGKMHDSIFIMNGITDIQWGYS